MGWYLLTAGRSRIEDKVLDANPFLVITSKICPFVSPPEGKALHFAS